jgi:hypothetical protein
VVTRFPQNTPPRVISSWQRGSFTILTGEIPTGIDSHQNCAAQTFIGTIHRRLCVPKNHGTRIPPVTFITSNIRRPCHLSNLGAEGLWRINHL